MFGDRKRKSSTWHLWCAEQLHSEVIFERSLQHLAQQGSTGTPKSLRGKKEDTLNVPNSFLDVTY